MTDRRIAFRLGCLLALGLAILHRGHFMSTDELGLFFQTRSLSQELSLAVPPRLPMAYPGQAGKSYSQYTIGQSLLAVPFHAAGRLLQPVLPLAVQHGLRGPIGPISWNGLPPLAFFPILLYPPVATGVLGALFFLFERRLGASRGASLAATLVLASCTQAALMSTLFLQHTTECIGALGAFYFWHRFRESGAARDVLLGSAFASSILNVRVAGAIDGLALGGYLLFVCGERFRAQRDVRWLATSALLALIPLAASVALYGWVNELKWGHWLESPMLDERGRMRLELGTALTGFLVSPGMSIFLYSPLLLLLPVTLPRLLRTFPAETCAVVALFVSRLLFYSSYELWTGLFSCPGPRYLFTALVFLMLPLGPWLGRARAPGRAAFFGLAALGAVVQLLSVIPSWAKIVVGEGYGTWQPPFGFLFEPETAPLMAAARRAFDPGYLDVWIAQIALGWDGQGPAPGVAGVVALCWLAAMLLLAQRLRQAVATSDQALR